MEHRSADLEQSATFGPPPRSLHLMEQAEAGGHLGCVRLGGLVYDGRCLFPCVSVAEGLGGQPHLHHQVWCRSDLAPADRPLLVAQPLFVCVVCVGVLFIPVTSSRRWSEEVGRRHMTSLNKSLHIHLSLFFYCPSVGPERTVETLRPADRHVRILVRSVLFMHHTCSSSLFDEPLCVFMCE